MSKFFYARLAAVNIRKNSTIYVPYILSCIFTVAMFYILLFISVNKGINDMKGGANISVLMVLGTIVIGIFAVIILLYTNSFLMKRRKKELGLYNVLGMGKNHIARVMAFETLYVAFGTIAAGLFVGILLSKLMLMLLFKMLTFRITFGFEISPLAVGITAALFAGIFLVTLLVNLGRVHLSKPIELLYGGNVGEKEPKTKWPLAVIGALSLGTGYVLALTIVNPLTALRTFFLAVLLVILGTYCLFTSGSIALLKALRTNKNFFYKTRHFTSVSGMLYRMKQNAVGLANICVLSTMVLVMVSTTVSLSLGLNDEVRNRYPRNIEIVAAQVEREDRNVLQQKIDTVIKGSGIPIKNSLAYSYKSVTLTEPVSGFSFISPLDKNAETSVYFIPLADYNALEGTAETLADNEVMVYSPNTDFSGTTVTFKDKSYAVKTILKNLNAVEDYNYNQKVNNLFYFIMPDEASIKEAYGSLTDGNADWSGFTYYYGFDTLTDGIGQVSLSDKISSAVSESSSPNVKNSGNTGKEITVTSAEANKDMFLYLYGGLFFLGIFLGALFIMATVIIMYYKQMSEGYDDKKRFEIMQKVGLSRDEIKKTIRSQVLTVFFLPLLAAGIHILAAFNMITKMLFLLSLSNVRLFAECTLGTFALFALIYTGVYALTARAYYRIVS